MATVQDRNGRWRVQVRLKGYEPQSKYFAYTPKTKQQVKVAAKEWGIDQELKLKTAHVPTLRHREMQGWTLQRLIERYAGIRPDGTDIAGGGCSRFTRKKGVANEKIKLKSFMKRETALCKKAFPLTKRDFAECRDRLEKEIGPGTLRRIFGVIRHMYNVAMQEWDDIPLQTNPLEKLDLPSNPPGRQRIASQDEQVRLFEACKKFQRARVEKHDLWHSMILTALQTGLRRGTLLKLEWRDVDLHNKKTLTIRAEIDKEMAGRILPISNLLWWQLFCYGSRDEMVVRGVTRDGIEDIGPIRTFYHLPNDLVFPIKEKTHNRAWLRLCQWAGIPCGDEAGDLALHFHDLRHTAATQFASKPIRLDVRENAYMLGHKVPGMTSRYEHLELVEDIRTKLNAGYEYLEVWHKDEDMPQEPPDNVIPLMKKGA